MRAWVCIFHMVASLQDGSRDPTSWYVFSLSSFPTLNQGWSVLSVEYGRGQRNGFWIWSLKALRFYLVLSILFSPLGTAVTMHENTQLSWIALIKQNWVLQCITSTNWPVTQVNLLGWEFFSPSQAFRWMQPYLILNWNLQKDPEPEPCGQAAPRFLIQRNHKR